MGAKAKVPGPFSGKVRLEMTGETAFGGFYSARAAYLLSVAARRANVRRRVDAAAEGDRNLPFSSGFIHPNDIYGRGSFRGASALERVAS